MTSQTLSPESTGEIPYGDAPTQPLDPFRLRRPDAQHFHSVDQLPRTIGVVPELTHPDTMPVPPRPPTRLFQPDAPSSPQPFPAPVPAGPKPRTALVPMLRPAAPGELYADSRARRGLPPMQRKPRGYVGRHRKASR